MRQFTALVSIANGLHGRPAMELVRTAGSFQSHVTLIKDGRGVSAKGLMAVMTLCVKQGDCVTVTVDGPDEDAAAPAIEQFFREHLS